MATTGPRSAHRDTTRRFRTRTVIADAAFIAEGVTLGLLLKWAERAPPFDDLPPRIPARRAPDGAVFPSGPSPERS